MMPASIALPLVFVLFLVAAPISMLVFGSIWSAAPGDPGELTLANYANLVNDPYTMTLAANTVLYSAGAALLALTIGTVLAFIVARTNTPFRNAFFFVPTMIFILPGMMDNIGWIYLLSPRTGLLNVVLMNIFGLKQPVFNVFSLAGMIWVMGIAYVPFTFLVLSAVFSRMNPVLEESARLSGSGMVRTFVRITLPMMRPALASVFLLLFIRAFESFETPALIGRPADVPVFMSTIFWYVAASVPARWGQATAYAAIIIVITLTGVWVYRRLVRQSERYQVVTGKGYQATVIDIGKWRFLGLAVLVFYGFIHAFLLLFTITILSFKPFWDPKNLFAGLTLSNYSKLAVYPNVTRGFVNSAIVGGLSVSLAVLLAVTLSYVSMRTKYRGRGYAEVLGMIPQAFPGMILAIGLLWFYVWMPEGIYGTLNILVLAWVTLFLPTAMRMVSPAVAQIHNELEEASRASGASFSTTLRRVFLPLMGPAVMSAWIYLFIGAYKELSAAILLVTSGNELFSTVLWDLWWMGDIERLAAASVLMMIAIGSMLVVARVAFRTQLRG